MPYEFDILETSHSVDAAADDRGLKETAWEPLTLPMEQRSREGWELVDVDVHMVITPNKYGRSQKVRTVISVWKRPTPERVARAASPAREPVLRLDD